MTWAIGTKLIIFSIAFMMIFAVIPPSYADGTIVIEDSIDASFEIDPVSLGISHVNQLSVLTIEYDCANSGDPATTLDPVLEVVDPDGDERIDDDNATLPGCGGGFFGSVLVYSGDQLNNGVYSLSLRDFEASTGPYTLTITLVGPGEITTGPVGEAPPTDPTTNAPKGNKDLVITPNGACDAVQNAGGGGGKVNAITRTCGVVAEDDTYEVDSFLVTNVLDNDLNKATGSSIGLAVTVISNVDDNLPAGSAAFIFIDGTFSIFCGAGFGILTFTYTAINLLGLSDTADVSLTCFD